MNDFVFLSDGIFQNVAQGFVIGTVIVFYIYGIPWLWATLCKVRLPARSTNKRAEIKNAEIIKSRIPTKRLSSPDLKAKHLLEDTTPPWKMKTDIHQTIDSMQKRVST